MSELRRRKVLMLIPNLGYGGAQRSFLALKKVLERHHDVLAIAFDNGGGGNESDTSEEGFQFLGQSGEALGVFGRVKRWYRRYARLKHLKQQHGAEISISFLEGADVLNVLTRGTERTLVSIRGSKRFDPHIRGLQGLIRRHLVWPLIYPKADAIVGISGGVSAEVHGLGFVGRGATLETIGLSLNVARMVAAASEPVEREFSSISECPVIVSWGRLSDEKGYGHLLRVFAGVKQVMSDAKLLLIGDGPFKDVLVSEAERLGLRIAYRAEDALASDLLLIGYRESPIRYAKLARVFILSSDAEGFGNSLVEALAAGLPVMAADCPWGARSVLSTNPPDVNNPYPSHAPSFVDFGVLMPRIDLVCYEQVWIDEVVRALSGRGEYDTYRHKGPIRALEFDESKVARKWLDVVDVLAIKKRGLL